MGKICFDVDKFRDFISKAFKDPDIYLDFNKFKVWNKEGTFILEGIIMEDLVIKKHENIYDKAEKIQERINKGEVKIIPLGIINGSKRYKFVEIKKELIKKNV